MTEDEAKTKWCPFASVTTYDKYAGEFKSGVTVGMCASNKTSEGTIRDGARCIGNECAVWRSFGPRTTINPQDRDSYGNLKQYEYGCCGLAGKP